MLHAQLAVEPEASVDVEALGNLMDEGARASHDLAFNARWRLTDEHLARLWQAEFPNSRTRYSMKSVRAVRNLFNLGRRNNDPPRTPIPQYDSAGNPVLDMPYF